MAARRQSKDLRFDLDGRDVPVALRRNRQARRIIMRVDPKTDGVRLTLPWYASEAEALGFLASQQAWLRRRLEKLPERTPFADGQTIPILGIDHTITHRGDAKRGVWLEGTRICVSGDAEHLPRRLGGWLRKEAKRRLSDLALVKARTLGVQIGRVTVRDTTSRWGSCAHDGSLNFSWRMIMAPDFVFDFIVAHEVAHIIERNHGPDFHTLVGTLTPHEAQAEAWLNAYGATLHRIG
ncbi:MAG: SprT family zinc-dependent metalloprotease [Rhodospirillales bacterium]